jgi:triphosphoribosyl-dephospho-CoA synthase
MRHLETSSARAAPPPLASLARAIAAGLRHELYLTPKPGLVDLEDAGSHEDLSLEKMERSIALVERYLADVAASLARGEQLAAQVGLGRAAEERMRAELGANTHKGAIFLGGLVLVGRHRAAADDERSLRSGLAAAAGELAAAAPLGTHGDEARRRFGVRGILGEAAAGLPSVFDAALPAFRAARAAGVDAASASFLMMARLMGTVEDTTALHRCGARGLAQLREDGARLAELVPAGLHVPFLRERNAAYRRMNLTMGGVADLLGVALGQLAYRRELAAPARRGDDRAVPPR